MHREDRIVANLDEDSASFGQRSAHASDAPSCPATSDSARGGGLISPRTPLRLASRSCQRSACASTVAAWAERRRGLAADNRRGLVDQLVVLEGLDHEQGEVHAACAIALEDGVAHVPTPHGETLAFALFEIAPANHRTLFLGLIGPDAVDYVKLPLGVDLALGDTYGSGQVVMHDGLKMLEVPLWRSYLAGCILLGIAPCTAMVLVWGYLARGNDGHTLVMVAINSLTMLVLYGVLGGFLLGVGKLPVPWQALLLSIGIYVALPLVAGYVSRKWIIAAKGEAWFKDKFLHYLTPVTISALLVTLILLFSFKGEVILSNPLTILWIAIPLLIQTVVIFALGYALSKSLRLTYENAAPSAMIGASNHFEVAIATATMLFGLSSGAALATVVGVLIEVPVMLMLVKFCLRTRDWFEHEPAVASVEAEAAAEAT